MRRIGTLTLAGVALLLVGETAAQENVAQSYEYLLLATKKTSTMNKELNEAAEAGYRMRAVMGGGTSFGGKETVTVMSRDPDGDHAAMVEYKLLATSRTSTMQKEMREAAETGWIYVGQTAYSSMFGGREVVVIMERELDTEPHPTREYVLLATKKTSTMQKELREVGEQGFALVGMTVAKTKFGGEEIVTILERPIE